MIMTFLFVAMVVAAYLLGSLSTAVILCRLAGLPDPRTTGSKNPGATNVLRLGGKKLAALTLFFDALKGFIPVAVMMFLNPNPILVGSVMVSVFLGHLYPIFFGFEGGKGVATALGAVFAVSPVVGLLLLITWGLAAFLFRISSLAALIAALLAPIYMGLVMNGKYVIPMVILSSCIIWRHRANIQRLLKGVEPKIGEKPRS